MRMRKESQEDSIWQTKGPSIPNRCNATQSGTRYRKNPYQEVELGLREDTRDWRLQRIQFYHNSRPTPSRNIIVIVQHPSSLPLSLSLACSLSVVCWYKGSGEAPILYLFYPRDFVISLLLFPFPGILFQTFQHSSHSPVQAVLLTSLSPFHRYRDAEHIHIY